MAADKNYLVQQAFEKIRKLSSIPEIEQEILKLEDTLNEFESSSTSIPVTFDPNNLQLIVDNRWQNNAYTLIQQNFRIIKTKGDGNCLYRALSLAIYGKDTFSSIIRLLQVRHIIREFAKIQKLETTFNKTTKEILTTTKQLSENAGEGWGEELNILIASDIFGRPIFVNQPSGRGPLFSGYSAIYISNPETINNKPIHLICNHGHFQPALPIRDDITFEDMGIIIYNPHNRVQYRYKYNDSVNDHQLLEDYRKHHNIFRDSATITSDSKIKWGNSQPSTIKKKIPQNKNIMDEVKDVISSMLNSIDPFSTRSRSASKSPIKKKKKTSVNEPVVLDPNTNDKAHEMKVFGTKKCGMCNLVPSANLALLNYETSTSKHCGEVAIAVNSVVELKIMPKPHTSELCR